MKKYRYLPPHFVLNKRQQRSFFSAGLTIVFCYIQFRKVYIYDGKTCDCISQQTREASAARADISLSPRFICYIGGKLTAKSADFLSNGLLNLLIAS